MAVRASREVVVDASPEAILDVLADIDAVPSWSSLHKSAEVLDRHPDGKPHHVKATLKIMGITDKEILEYHWGDAGAIRHHHGPRRARARVHHQAGQEDGARRRDGPAPRAGHEQRSLTPLGVNEGIFVQRNPSFAEKVRLNVCRTRISTQHTQSLNCVASVAITRNTWSELE